LEIFLKRLNPDTGKPFRRGEYNEDKTKRFDSYNKSIRGKGEFCYEVWQDLEKFNEKYPKFKSGLKRRNRNLEEKPEILKKRLNPDTEKPFRRGEYNEDKTKRFDTYNTAHWGEGEFCYEVWRDLETFKKLYPNSGSRKVNKNYRSLSDRPDILKKRLNPDTGKPFVRGEFNEDRTKRFSKYESDKWGEGDYCIEHWLVNKSYDRYYDTNSTKSIYDRCRSAKQGAKRRAKLNNIPFNITRYYLFTIWPKDNKCPVFNKEFSPLGDSFTPFSPTLDKIIPELGYVEGNVVWISRRANSMKSDGTLKDVEAVYEWLKKKTEEVKKND